MANAITGNMLYTDIAETVTTNPVKVTYLFITATSANAIVKIEEPSTGATVFDLEVSSAGDSKQFSFEQKPLYVPNGSKVGTLTNAVVTFIGDRAGG